MSRRWIFFLCRWTWSRVLSTRPIADAAIGGCDGITAVYARRIVVGPARVTYNKPWLSGGSTAVGVRCVRKPGAGHACNRPRRYQPSGSHAVGVLSSKGCGHDAPDTAENVSWIAGNRRRTSFSAGGEDTAVALRSMTRNQCLPPGDRLRYLRGARCNQHLHRRGCTRTVRAPRK